MPDLQQTIDEIRFFLQSENQEDTPQVRQLAEDYAAFSKEVNQRLRRCGDYLRQGLWSEAIQLAEAAPRLLDVLSTIDFPERNEWEGVLAMYHVPLPEPLLLDVAEQLNEAYATQQPLERLLERHRLLAIARAPLNQRLAVMRSVTKLDTSSNFWEDDIKAFEKVRISEIEAGARAAASKGDSATLKVYCDELERPDWLQRPPKPLLETVRRLNDEAQRKAARNRLQQLEPELHAAFSSLDQVKSRGLRQEWLETAQTARLSPGDELAERVAPVLAWLSDEDTRQATEQRFQTAVVALEQLLDREEVTVEELHQAGHAVECCDRMIPMALATRYQNRQKMLELGSRRRHQLVIGAVVACVVLVVALVSTLIRFDLQGREIRRIAQSAEQLMTDGNLAEARKLLDANGQFSTHELWLAASSALTELEKKESGRLVELKSAMESARKAEDVTAAAPHVSASRNLARTPEEKVEVARLEDQLRSAQMQQRAESETKFGNQLKRLADHVAALEGAGDSGTRSQSFIEKLNKSTLLISELRRLSGTVNPQLTSQLDLLASRSDAMRKRRDLDQQREEFLENLARTSAISASLPAGDTEMQAYVDTLSQYRETLKNDGRNRDFEQVVKEADLWRGILAWRRLQDEWATFEPADAAAAKQRIEQLQAWRSANANTPSVASAQFYLSYLQSALRREQSEAGDSEEGLRAQVLKLFSGSLMTDVHYVELLDNRRFYISTPEVFDSPIAVTFSSIMSFSGAKRNKIFKPAELKHGRSHPAPQSVLAKQMRDKFTTCSLQEWDVQIRALTLRLVSDNELHPLLRYVLLKNALELASRGNSLCAQELQAITTKLKDDSIDVEARWMDPDDKAAQTSRRRAEAVLATVDSKQLDAAWERANAARIRAAQLLFEKNSIAGCLIKDNKNRWSCRGSWKPVGSQTLVVALPDSTGKVGDWTVVGSADPSGKIVLQPSQSHAFKEGRLVFARLNSDPTR